MEAPPEPAEVRAVRDRLGVSQSRLAGLLGATTRAVQAWEAGERPISGPAWVLMQMLAQYPQVLRWRERWLEALDAPG
jgi:putative transcriptional regulator